MTDRTITDPETAYLQAAIAYHEASIRPGYKAVNRAHDAIIDAARLLVLRDDRGKPFFLKLQAYPLERVRLWAAVHLLPLDELVALRTLAEIAENGRWEASLSAETAIAEWKAGRFDPYWFLKEDKKR